MAHTSIVCRGERYIKLRSCVSKVCVNVNIDSKVTADDMKTFKDICSCLEPLKVSTEALCQNDATLLSAEATIYTISVKQTV